MRLVTFLVCIAPWLIETAYGSVATDEASSMCQNVFPACRNMAHGVDVTTFSPWSTDTGMKQQIIDFTCNDPGTIDQWQVPDQFEPEVTSIAGSVRKYTDVSIRVSDELRASVAASVSTSAFFGMASASAWFSAAIDLIYDRSFRWSSVTAMVSAWKPQYRSEWSKHAPVFGADAQGFIDKFLVHHPVLNASTVALWNKFISVYGTDRMDWSCQGGMMRYEYATSNAYIGAYGEAKMHAQAKLGFFGFLKASGAITEDVAKVDQAWLESSMLWQLTLGGQVTPVDPASFTAWQVSLAKQPHVVPCDGLQPPMTQLIPHTDMFPPSLRLAFAAARDNYIKRSFLQSEVLPQLYRFTGILNQQVTQPSTCVAATPPFCTPNDHDPWNPRRCPRDCPGHCCGNVEQIKRDYTTVATSFLARTRARLTTLSYLTSNVTSVLLSPIIEPGAFARLTAQFVNVASVFVSGATTLVCNIHSSSGTCHFPDRAACCTNNDYTPVKSAWFNGV